MAASQPIENQQRSYEVFEQKHYMECTTHGSRSGSGVGNHESHRRKSRMVEISSSGSGEGPGRVTSRPTLQGQLALPFVRPVRAQAVSLLAPHSSWTIERNCSRLHFE